MAQEFVLGKRSQRDKHTHLINTEFRISISVPHSPVPKVVQVPVLLLQRGYEYYDCLLFMILGSRGKVQLPDYMTRSHSVFLDDFFCPLARVVFPSSFFSPHVLLTCLHISNNTQIPSFLQLSSKISPSGMKRK